MNKESNDTASEFVRNKIRGIVKDTRTAELLAPKDHPIGTKRLCLDTNYYETYNRDNVTLVDVRSDPIQEITATGLRTAGGQQFELDAIVFATGFDAMTGALREIDMRTTDGAVLADHWEGGPLTYLGLMVSGFPNMFVVTGPGSPGVKTQMIASIEQHVDWIADCIGHMRDARASTASRPRRRPSSTGCSTSTRWPTARSIRWPTPGTWAPTFPASRACSCPMSAASTATSGIAMPSPPRATRDSSSPATNTRWLERCSCWSADLQVASSSSNLTK